MEATDYLNQFPNITVTSRQSLCETPYLATIFEHLAAYPFFMDFRFIITDHLSTLPEVNPAPLVFYLSNEDGRLPQYLEDIGLLLTPYPPSEAHPKVLPIPLGYNGHVPALPVKTLTKRNRTVFFSGRKLHRRKAALNQLDTLKENMPDEVYCQKTKGCANGLNPREYAIMLYESQVAVAPEGNFSNITFRLFEALRQGAVPVTPPLPNTWYFEHFPGFQLSDWAELKSVIKEVQRQPEGRQEKMLHYYRTTIAGPAVAAKIAETIKAYCSL